MKSKKRSKEKQKEYMVKRDFKGVWIPKVIWLADLSPVEKCLLAEIHSLDGGYGCFATNQYLGWFLNLSGQRVADIITKLRRNHWIVNLKMQPYDWKKNIQRRMRVVSPMEERRVQPS